MRRRGKRFSSMELYREREKMKMKLMKPSLRNLGLLSSFDGTEWRGRRGNNVKTEFSSWN